MKKLKFILLSLFVFTMTVGASCVKQKNCEYCESGKWIYLKKPYTVSGAFGTSSVTVVAHFYPDTYTIPYRTVGKVPKKFQSTDTINVCLTYKTNLDDFENGVHRLDCIEKIK